VDAVDPTAVAAPVLLVVGGASAGPTVRLVDRLAGLLPDAAVATVAGADHLLPLTHPGELAALVSRVPVRPAGSTA
jgi:pimeloyl-ACP methyl ester carboxylesterase